MKDSRSIYFKSGKKIKGENFTEPPYFKIVDTPGFAPVYDENHPNKRPNINGYAPVTGFFNENYLEVERESGNTYREDGYTVFNHGGVDFRGGIGIEIKSLIYGTVLAYGKYSTYGRTILMGGQYLSVIGKGQECIYWHI